MPYSRPFLRIRINGSFGPAAATEVEQWSTGFNVSTLGGGSVDPASLLTYLGAIQGPIATYHQSANVAAGQGTFLKTLTAAYLGTDGLYVLGGLQPTTLFTYSTPVAGAGSETMPHTNACVISLRSLRLRGPASHGRMYWPACALKPTTSDGTISSTATGLIATAAKTMIDAINTASGAQFGTASKVSLVSRVGAGAEAVVTQVKVDQKLDHMESRERSIKSNYSSATTAAAAAEIARRDQELRDGYDELEQQN